MKLASLLWISAIALPASSFYVPFGRYSQKSNSLTDSATEFSRRSNGSLHMALDPADVATGTAFTIGNLPLLVAPVAAAFAGFNALNQRDKIKEEIATTEAELESIKQRLESSELLANGSFGVAVASFALAVATTFGGDFQTQSSVSSIPSTVMAKDDISVVLSKEPQKVTTPDPVSTPELSEVPEKVLSLKAVIPPTIDAEKTAVSTFDTLMKKLETFSETPTETTATSEKIVEVKPTTEKSNEAIAPILKTESISDSTKIPTKSVAPEVVSNEGDSVTTTKALATEVAKTDQPKVEILQLDEVKDGKLSSDVDTPKLQVETPKQQAAEIIVPSEVKAADLKPDSKIIKDEDLKTDSKIIKVEDLKPDSKALKVEDLKPDSKVLNVEDLKPDSKTLKVEDLKPDSKTLKVEDLKPDSKILKVEDLKADSKILKVEDLKTDSKILKVEDMKTDSKIFQNTQKTEPSNVEAIKSAPSQNDVLKSGEGSVKSESKETDAGALIKAPSTQAVPVKIETALDKGMEMTSTVASTQALPSINSSIDKFIKNTGIDTSAVPLVAGLVGASALVTVGLIVLSGSGNGSNEKEGTASGKKTYAPTAFDKKVPVPKVQGYLDNLSKTTGTSNDQAKSSGFLEGLKVETSKPVSVNQFGYLDAIASQKGAPVKSNNVETTKVSPTVASPTATGQEVTLLNESVSQPAVQKKPFPQVSIAVESQSNNEKSYLETVGGSGPPKVKAPFKAPYNARRQAQTGTRPGVPIAASSYLDSVATAPPLPSNYAQSAPISPDVSSRMQSSAANGWSTSSQKSDINGFGSSSTTTSAEPNGWGASPTKDQREPNEWGASVGSSSPNGSSTSENWPNEQEQTLNFRPPLTPPESAKDRPVARRFSVGAASYLDAL